MPGRDRHRQHFAYLAAETATRRDRTGGWCRNTVGICYACRAISAFSGLVPVAFSSERAEIRFGCGLSPRVPGPATPLDILRGLNTPDRMARRFPIEGFSTFLDRVTEYADARARARKSGQKDQLRALRRKAGRASTQWYVNTLLRWTYTGQGMRERLVGFWGDHFTARGKQAILRSATSPYIEAAIRPNIAGTFADLLIATTTHPLMLYYLDQNRSVGPQSRAAAKRRKLTGLNENLAREVMELHTMGVDGPYTQDDVRQLAELFTGLTVDAKTGFRFRPGFAEPGPETVLGKSYGGDPASLAPVLQVLRDLAVHPATARHIAWKLAVHFVADTPEPGLIDHVAGRFVQTGGDLMAVYGALIEHPAAWEAGLRNVKPPFDFIASTCRALVVDPDRIVAMGGKGIRRALELPLGTMGQPWQQPAGPDGWPEEDKAWITPQGISARLRWAMVAPDLLRPDLPDPRDFVVQALGPYATGAVRFAASAAESKSDAIGLVLASPEFQRR
jgi:uncharacterized protein (DUF1800 family)